MLLYLKTKAMGMGYTLDCILIVNEQNEFTNSKAEVSVGMSGTAQ